MLRLLYIFTAITAWTVACGARVISLDSATLLQNGLEAQDLNAAFANLSANDSCISGTTACISGAIALCVEESWFTEECADSLQCFALPALRRNGAFLSCTTEAIASSIINMTGANGDVASNSTSTNISSTSTASSTASSSVLASSSISSISASGVIVLSSSSAASNIQPASTLTSSAVSVASITTIPAQTFTLNSSQISSLLSSFAAGQSAFATANTILSSPTTTSTPASNLTSVSRSVAGFGVGGSSSATGGASVPLATTTTMCHS